MRFKSIVLDIFVVAATLGRVGVSAEPRCAELSAKQTKNVAIIGAGSGGSSAAYYLSKFTPPDSCVKLNVTIFERSDYIGGRTTTVNVYNDDSVRLELGGSIFVEVNQNLVSAVKEFNLTLNGDENDSGNEFRAAVKRPDALGIWDGKSFVFVEPASESLWKSVLKLVWKYGLAPIRTRRLMQKTVGAFLKLYSEPYFPFHDLGSAAAKVGLGDALKSTIEQFLEDNWISKPFSTDIILASTRVNYAQNLEQIHGLEGMVCMAIDGAMSVAGGNWQIFKAMLDRSAAAVHLSKKVTSIARRNNKFVLSKEPKDERSSAVVDEFDKVIIATPLQFADIAITPPLANPPKKIDYVSLHVTLLTTPHNLSPHYFNLPKGKLAPTAILTTLPNGRTSGAPSTPFNSISALRRTFNPHTYPPRAETAYKIFSPHPLNASLIASLFNFKLPAHISPSAPLSALHAASKPNPATGTGKGDISWLHEKTWNSYPYLPPRESFDGPALGKDIWYTSGIESFISTMETSSLAGMNVAKLLWNEVEAEEKLERLQGLRTGQERLGRVNGGAETSRSEL